MRFDVLTLFPETIEKSCDFSIIKRATEQGLISVNAINPRDFSKDKHKKVDDTPYGGGAGMLLSCQPYLDALSSVEKKENSQTIIMSPQGKVFNQEMAKYFAVKEQLIIICGHYEGFDERIKTIIDLELSIGDYVLTGGELPSMVVMDSVIRLVSGVINSNSLTSESFNDNLLDYPNYTKPIEYRGMKVPDVLLSGHHKNIEEFRYSERIKLTKENRPDLLGGNNEE